MRRLFVSPHAWPGWGGCPWDAPGESCPNPSVIQLMSNWQTAITANATCRQGPRGLRPKVLPDLRKAKNHADPEVRRGSDDLICPGMVPRCAEARHGQIQQEADQENPGRDYQANRLQDGVLGGGGGDSRSTALSSTTFPSGAIDKITEKTGSSCSKKLRGRRLRFNSQDSVVSHTPSTKDRPHVATLQYSRSMTSPPSPKTTGRHPTLRIPAVLVTIFVEPEAAALANRSKS